MYRITISKRHYDLRKEWHPQKKRRVVTKVYKVLKVEGRVFYTAGGNGKRFFHPGVWISDVEIQFLQPRGVRVIRMEESSFVPTK